MRNCRGQRHWAKMFKVLKEKKKQKTKTTTSSGILYPTKLAFRTGRGSKVFPERRKLREFVIIRSALQEMIKGILQDAVVGQ